MNLLYVNYIPDKISNKKINEYLHSLANEIHSFNKTVEFNIYVATDIYPKIDNFFNVILSYFSKKFGNDNIYDPPFVYLDSLLEQLKTLTPEQIKDKNLLHLKNKNIYDKFFQYYSKKFSSAMDKFIIISGDKYYIGNTKCEKLWGQALLGGNVCINRRTEKHVIWHETAHLLGADDHYKEKEPYKMKKICKDPTNCIMRYVSLEKNSFCDRVKKEIDKYLNKCKNC